MQSRGRKTRKVEDSVVAGVEPPIVYLVFHCLSAKTWKSYVSGIG